MNILHKINKQNRWINNFSKRFLTFAEWMGPQRLHKLLGEVFEIHETESDGGHRCRVQVWTPAHGTYLLLEAQKIRQCISALMVHTKAIYKRKNWRGKHRSHLNTEKVWNSKFDFSVLAYVCEICVFVCFNDLLVIGFCSRFEDFDVKDLNTCFRELLALIN